MAIRFIDDSIKSGLIQRNALKKFIANSMSELSGKNVDLTFIFVTDEALLSLNIGYLKHDTLTDIITFDLSETDNFIIGEIYISGERVQENAPKFNVSYNNELHRVIFHGALHLCGYKDKKPAHKAEMRRMEQVWLNQYFESKT
jgi:probable rRNA maturation factor